MCTHASHCQQHWPTLVSHLEDVPYIVKLIVVTDFRPEGVLTLA